MDAFTGMRKHKCLPFPPVTHFAVTEHFNHKHSFRTSHEEVTQSIKWEAIMHRLSSFCSVAAVWMRADTIESSRVMSLKDIMHVSLTD